MLKINQAVIAAEVPGLFRIIPLNPFRRTSGVFFDNIPTGAFPRIDAIDRVMHVSHAVSPGPVGEAYRPWYMHTHQDDNLIVLHGTRYVDLYTRKHGRIESFTAEPELIRNERAVIYEGAALLCWPRGVFHRIRSSETGSASLNFAVHHEGVDMRTNFNIYDVAIETGTFRVIREGYLDQPESE